MPPQICQFFPLLESLIKNHDTAVAISIMIFVHKVNNAPQPNNVLFNFDLIFFFSCVLKFVQCPFDSKQINI